MQTSLPPAATAAPYPLVYEEDLEDDNFDVETTLYMPGSEPAEEIDVNKWPDIPFLDPATLVPALNPIKVVDGAGLEKVRAYLNRVNEYVHDYETNIVDRFYHRKARTLQLGDRNEQYLIDLLAFAETTERLTSGQGLYRKKNIMSDADIAILEPVVSIIRPSLESNSHLKVGTGLDFEYMVSKWCLGIRSWNFHCTLRGERSLSNGAVPLHEKNFWGLKDQVRRYCKLQISKASQKTFDLSTPLTDEQWIYMALDVRLPAVVKAVQMKKIEKAGLQWSVQIDMDAIPPFGDMHLNGMLADPVQWQKIIDDNKAELKKAIAEMDTFFIPVVGQKVMWDQDEIDRKEAAYRSYDEKSPEEVRLSEELRTCRKDAVRTAELKELRAAHEAARKAAKQVAKAEYMVERAKGGAKAREAYGKMAGEAAINYGAPQQLLKALHDGPFGFNKVNLRESNDKAMEKHADKPVIKAIRRFRSLMKSLGTYGERWILTRDQKDAKGKFGFVDPDTGRIHADFRQGGADTGRPSCTDPNMLNLPQDERYRHAFISRPGNDMVDKDCAGQELRILTEYSKEPAWIEAFQKKQDLHSISAEMINPELWKASTNWTESIFSVDGKIKTIPPCAFYLDNGKFKCDCPKHKSVRNDYKAFNFGVVYDKSAFSFAIELGKPVDVVEAMLNRWKTTFAVTQKTLERLRNAAYEKGEARTLSGRRRIMRKVSWEQAKKAANEKYHGKANHQQITQTMQNLIAGVKREAGNMPIQGTGADLMMLAMGCGFDPNGEPYLWHVLEPKYDAQLLNYVYDEFLVESPEKNRTDPDDPESNVVSEIVSDAIVRAGAEFVKVVPMESDGKVSKRWSK